MLLPVVTMGLSLRPGVLLSQDDGLASCLSDSEAGPQHSEPQHIPPLQWCSLEFGEERIPEVVKTWTLASSRTFLDVGLASHM